MLLDSRNGSSGSENVSILDDVTWNSRPAFGMILGS
jgi:hypothetical protein